jgi:hypothetical protein
VGALTLYDSGGLVKTEDAVGEFAYEGYATATTTDAYLFIVGAGVQMDGSAIGYKAPYDCTCVRIEWFKDNTADGGTILVKEGSTTRAQAATTAGAKTGVTTGLSGQVSAGGIIGLYVDGTCTDELWVRAVFRRRAT